MKLTSWSRTAVFPLLAAAAFAAACGNPGPTGNEFVFTPVPYTVLPAEPGETPVVVALDDEGDVYYAAELSFLIDEDELSAFLEWLESVGLEGVRLDEERPAAERTMAAERGVTLDKAIVFVKVPRGGAIAARDLLRTRRGLEDVELDYPFYTQ